MILQEILRLVDFDNVVPLFEEIPEKYINIFDLYYGIEELHRYREFFDEMCQMPQMPWGDGFTIKVVRREDGGLRFHEPDIGPEVEVACPVYFDKDGEKILWAPEHSGYISAEEIACAAVLNIPGGNVDTIWLYSRTDISRYAYLHGLHKDNPYFQNYFRINERLRRTILPKRFWKDELINRESAKYVRVAFSGHQKRNRAKRKRRYRWNRRLSHLAEMTRRWNLYTSISKLTTDESLKATLWDSIKNAEALGHEGFCSFNPKNATEYIEESISKYYRGNPIDHDLSLVVVRASDEAIAANKDIEELLRQSGLCHNPHFFYATGPRWGEDAPTDFTVEILYIKNPYDYPHICYSDLTDNRLLAL